LCIVNVAFAQSEWTKLSQNVKTDTFGNTKYFGKKLSYEEAVRISMYFASYYNGYNYDVKQYSKKDFAKLAKNMDFEQEYIYGAAVKAVNELGYGIASIDYQLMDDEIINEVGFNSLYFMKLKDDSVLCLKIIKPSNVKIADSCVWDKENDMLILKNSTEGYEYHIYLYGLEIENGSYQVLGSDANPKLEAELIGSDYKNWAKTTLFVDYDGETIKVYGDSSFYAPINDTYPFYYKGNLITK